MLGTAWAATSDPVPRRGAVHACARSPCPSSSPPAVSPRTVCRRTACRRTACRPGASPRSWTSCCRRSARTSRRRPGRVRRGLALTAALADPGRSAAAAHPGWARGTVTPLPHAARGTGSTGASATPGERPVDRGPGRRHCVQLQSKSPVPKKEVCWT